MTTDHHIPWLKTQREYLESLARDNQDDEFMAGYIRRELAKVGEQLAERGEA